MKTAGLGLGIVILLAGLMTFWNGLSHLPGEKAHVDFITGATVIGGALGIIAAALGWFDAVRPQGDLMPGAYYGIGAVLAAGIAWFIECYGMHQIGGFDHGALVETAWRLYKGQIPYVDFPCTVPVGFMLGAKFALQWFGVHWRSFIDITALFAVGSFVWSLFLLGELFGRRWATLVWAVALQAMSMMFVAYWWYNPVTSIASVLYVLSAALWLHRPASKSAMASYGLALLVAATMKPNTTGILVPLITIILFSSSLHRWKTVFISIGAFVLFAGFLWINHITVVGMVKSYLSVAQRGLTLEQFMQFTSALAKEASLAAAAIVVLPLAVVFYQGRKALLSRPAAIPLIALVAGAYGFLTNGELKLVDLTLILAAAILLVAELRSPKIPTNGPTFVLPIGWNRYLSWVCVILAFAGIALGMRRERVKAIGMPLFFEYDDTKHVMNGGFFDGLHCGDIFDEMIKEIAAVLKQAPGSTVWFGPRMQWSYAAFDQPSPINQPVWWHPGVAFAKADEEMYFSRFLASRFNVLILFKNDVSYFSKEEVQRIVAQYDVDQSLPLLTVLRLKP